MANTITSANSVYILTIPGVYAVGQQLQGFMADAAFATEAAETSENIMGVDGVMSSGWVPRMYKQTISIMPDSPSSVIFDAWVAAQDAISEIYPAAAILTMTSIGRKFAMNNGVISNYNPIPEARRVLQGRPFTITWGVIAPLPF
jgi:hypothetical protein